MMALGALDRFESKSATMLFNYSKALLFANRNNNARHENRRMLSSSSTHSTLRQGSIDEMCCLLCLAHFATWQSDLDLRNEAPIMQSLLGQSLRLSDLEESREISHSLGWREWSQQESARRTKLLAFCFLSTQSIAFDVPPSVWCDEINLVLPCPCEEWTAPNEDAWRLLRQNNLHQPRRFQDTLEILLSPDCQADHFLPNTSPVANYVLIHGLLQSGLWARRSISEDISQHYQPLFE